MEHMDRATDLAPAEKPRGDLQGLRHLVGLGRGRRAGGEGLGVGVMLRLLRVLVVRGHVDELEY